MRKDKKEMLMVTSALVTLASGIIMSFLSFFLSLNHSVHDSVLFYFGQCLVYCGSAFGIAAYVKAKIGNLGSFDNDNRQEQGGGKNPQNNQAKSI